MSNWDMMVYNLTDANEKPFIGCQNIDDIYR